MEFKFHFHFSFSHNIQKQIWIGHFRVPQGLCFKTRVGAQPLIWKSSFILMQIKLIFTRKVMHLASFWKWGFMALRSGLLCLKTDLNFVFRFRPTFKNGFDSFFVTYQRQIRDESLKKNHWYLACIYTKFNATSDAPNDCENLGIKHVQQSESAIIHRIYFNYRKFPGIASNILKNVTHQFIYFRTLPFRNNVAFYMKQDFLAVSFSRLSLSKVEYSSGYLLFI